MAAKKTGKKKGHGIKVVGDEPATTRATAVLETPANGIVKPEGVEWGVRVKNGERAASDGRGDRVAQELAACTDVPSLVAFANEFLDPEKVQQYLDKAPNFGQFRMVIGNCIRGAINRAAKEKAKAQKAAK